MLVSYKAALAFDRRRSTLALAQRSRGQCIAGEHCSHKEKVSGERVP